MNLMLYVLASGIPKEHMKSVWPLVCLILLVTLVSSSVYAGKSNLVTTKREKAQISRDLLTRIEIDLKSSYPNCFPKYDSSLNNKTNLECLRLRAFRKAVSFLNNRTIIRSSEKRLLNSIQLYDQNLGDLSLSQLLRLKVYKSDSSEWLRSLDQLGPKRVTRVRETFRNFDRGAHQELKYVIPFTEKYRIVVAFSQETHSLTTQLAEPRWIRGTSEEFEVPSKILIDLFALGLQQEEQRYLRSVLIKRINEWQEDPSSIQTHGVAAIKYEIPTVAGGNMEEFHLPEQRIAFNHGAAFYSKKPRSALPKGSLVILPEWVADAAVQLAQHSELEKNFKTLLLKNPDLSQLFEIEP
jgi:hypothetical protein